MEIQAIDGNVGIVVPGIREMLKLALKDKARVWFDAGF
jgi:hypothetical protein